MRLGPSNKTGARRGAVAVEMAVAAPFLFLMFLVACDYCRVYYAAQIVTNAARSGALYASGTVPAASGLSPLQAAQQAAVAEGVSINLQPAHVSVTTSTSSAAVTVTYPFQVINPYLGLPPTLNLSATVTMPLSSWATR